LLVCCISKGEGGKILSDLKYRGLALEDKDWLTEVVNDPEAAKYALSIYPRTEHEVEEFVKRDIEDAETRHIVAELDDEPAGSAGFWWRNAGRDRHIAWLGISVRRRHWAKGVGSGLVCEVIRIAKEMGFRRLVLGVFEGNERALRLYKKLGFRNEACEHEEVYIDGSWRKGYIMGLDLAPCEPKHGPALTAQNRKHPATPVAHRKGVQIRHLGSCDLAEVNRLQNCLESTKSSYRVPPVSKEETRRWYEKINSEQRKYCLACFKDDRLLGYLHFMAHILPFPNLRFEEVIVDANGEPYEAAEALVAAIKDFKERYSYRRIFAPLPETSASIIDALEHDGFMKTGAVGSCYYIDGFYVDMAVYEYP
jgi:RimJ/RimL family protein N-acetyltransferase